LDKATATARNIQIFIPLKVIRLVVRKTY